MDDMVEYGARRRTAIIVQNAGERRDQLAALVLLCDCALLESQTNGNWKNLSNYARTLCPDYILADLSSDSDRTGDAIGIIAGYLNEYGTEALIWAQGEILDAAYAALPVSQCHFLVDAHDYEAMPILTGALKPMKMHAVQQGERQADYGALHKISDELADFARTLARIAEQDDNAPPVLNDKPVSYRPAPFAALESLIGGVVATVPVQSSEANAIRNLLKLRRKRESYFHKDLFADPAWDILLDLYAAQLEGKKVSVSSLCIAASVPPTTALRWITTMTEDGLLEREHDPQDARRVFIRQSTAANDSLRQYCAEIGLTGKLPI